MRVVAAAIVIASLIFGVFQWNEARRAREAAASGQVSLREEFTQNLKTLQNQVVANKIASDGGVARAERAVETLAQETRATAKASEPSIDLLKDLQKRLAERDDELRNLRQQFLMEQANAKRQLEQANTKLQAEALALAMGLRGSVGKAGSTSQPAVAPSGATRSPDPVEHRDGVYIVTFAFDSSGQRFQISKESKSSQDVQEWATQQCRLYRASLVSIFTVLDPK